MQNNAMCAHNAQTLRFTEPQADKNVCFRKIETI